MADSAIHGGDRSFLPASEFGLLEDYKPLPGAYDECIDDDGHVRPAYQALLSRWDHRDPAMLEAQRNGAVRYLRDNGVAHRVYGDDLSMERPWPLSDVPLVIDPDEWEALSKGLIQRAELLEAVVSDIYGPQTLVRDGVLPAPIVAGAPGFLRPLFGVTPRDGHHLHYIAIELGRGPDGRWWVLGDRTQAPSGAGYALENRLAMSRSVSSDLRQMNISRLAGFFHAFRESLSRLRGSDSTRVGLLTPGPYNETYYEQAFLARYLGMLLLEGGDLVARDGALFVRTVRGLKRIDVIWRRVDADYCDPLELRPDSQLGVTGFVDVLRQQGVTCLNSLGAGVLESRGFMAFWPMLAQKLLGESLLLPNIATWWHGNEDMRAQADSAQGDTIASDAFGTSLPLDRSHSAHIGDRGMGPGGRVTQESVRLSTLPVLTQPDGRVRLEPRPFSLRVFLARTSSGWSVMPGGFCRVSDNKDTRAVSMHDGSQSCDVWVTARGPVPPVSLLSINADQPVRRVPGTLPARAADNLFWLGRYAERAQMTMRLARAYLDRYSEATFKDDPLLETLAGQLHTWGIQDIDSPSAFTDDLLPGLHQAHQAASAIRDRFSPDAWQTLARFVAETQTPRFERLRPPEQINEALAMLAAFAGLASENMIRLSGWRFLEIGRRVERALGTSQIARLLAFAPDDQPDVQQEADLSGAEVLLEVADSVMSYRRRYAATIDSATVADLVVLDPNNPRSIAFQLEKINVHLDEISDHPPFEQPSDLQRLAFGMWSDYHAARISDLTTDDLRILETQLAALSVEISDAFIAPGEPAHSTIG